MMRKFFANMTIRSSLLWVLAFFSFMLVIGAALGVLSLRISNGTLAEIKQSQELDDAVGRVVPAKDTMNGLGRSAASNYADIVRNVGQATVLTQGLSADATGLLERAKASMNKGQAGVRILQDPAAAAGSRRGAEGNRRFLRRAGAAGAGPAGGRPGEGRHDGLPETGPVGAGRARRPLRPRNRRFRFLARQQDAGRLRSGRRCATNSCWWRWARAA